MCDVRLTSSIAPHPHPHPLALASSDFKTFELLYGVVSIAFERYEYCLSLRRGISTAFSPRYRCSRIHDRKYCQHHNRACTPVLPLALAPTLTLTLTTTFPLTPPRQLLLAVTQVTRRLVHAGRVKDGGDALMWVGERMCEGVYVCRWW